MGTSVWNFFFSFFSLLSRSFSSIFFDFLNVEAGIEAAAVAGEEEGEVGEEASRGVGRPISGGGESKTSWRITCRGEAAAMDRGPPSRAARSCSFGFALEDPVANPCGVG